MNGWPTKPLGDVSQFIRGISFKPTDLVDAGALDSLACFRTKNVQAELATDDLIYIPRSFVKNDRQLVQEGDVLISTANSNKLVGKCCYVPRLNYPATLGGFIAAIRSDPRQMQTRYLYYWLATTPMQARLRGLARQTTNISNLPLTDVAKERIPVPPLAEQERIVKLLDEADELRKLRAQADRRTADLIPALFQEMFGDPIANPKKWPYHKLPGLCDGKQGIKAGPFGSSLKKECYTAEGPRVYGQEQVIAGDFSIGDYHISEAKFAEMAAYRVKSGDLLISLVGTIGKVVIVPDGIECGIINPRLLRVRPRTDLLLPCYLAHVVTSPSVIQFLGSIATGITMGVLNAGLLKQLDVPLPPLPLQKEFAQRVNEIRTIDAEQAVSHRRLDELFHSLLHRTFEGGL